MITHFRNYYLVGTILLVISLRTSAQHHFSFTSNTGNNMTVLVQSSINPNIDGTMLSNGDEIGVFTVDGLCVGAVVWNNANITITVWGNDEQTTAVDGINANDTLYFRLWDASAAAESAAEVTYSTGPHTYSVDGISILGSLSTPPTAIHPPVTSLQRNAGLLSVNVFDISGKHVFRYSGTIPFSGISDLFRHGNLPNGNYFIALETDCMKIYRTISILK